MLDDPAAGVLVPPEERPIGVVFQDYLLFPHLTALENVAFGLRSRGAVAPRGARARRAPWLGRVGPGGPGRVPAQALSGGQAQRVALARALATEPAPAPARRAAVGARRRRARRAAASLRRHLAAYEGTCLVITHDPIEAMTLGDQLVVLEAGRVVQAGSPTSSRRIRARATSPTCSA